MSNKNKMKAEDLRHQFHNEEGISWENSQGEPDIDYVMWLERKVLRRDVAEAMPTEEWRYCPKCGTEWTNDCEQFGCWQCGNVRNRMEREKSLVDDDAMCHCTDPSLDRNGYCRECGGEINRMSEPNKEGREK